MRQVLQSLGSGETVLAEVPEPIVSRGNLLVHTARSLISAGTERMLIDFGRAGWIDKARQQPDKVRQVLDKVRTDGLAPTIDAVRSKLDKPLPLGYCNVGVVASVGDGVRSFVIGDRVVSNGSHAETVSVPRNLCARIPDGVSDDEAAFTVLGAIALQGLRLAAPTLGERFVVVGLGLIGLLAVQLLRANGCRVLGIDPDERKSKLAEQFGAEIVALGRGEDPLAAAMAFSGGAGVDGVIIAAATRSNEPVSQAAKMCRKRGRVVLVGVAGLELDRADFYRNEISFQVSCSYGPGRYDSQYEEGGHDYPIGFVRWTEQRNFEAVLDMIAARRLDLTPLMTHRFDLQDAPKAYDLLSSGAEPYLGILLQYPQRSAPASTTIVLTGTAAAAPPRGVPSVSFIGAGNYAGRVLIPAFQKTGATLLSVASSGGVSAAHFGRKFGFKEATSDAGAVVQDARSDIIVVATRHETHGRFVCTALSAGRHVFVEKPLAITMSEVDAIESAWRSSRAAGQPQVMVGFNRRFAPHVVRMKSLLEVVRAPKSFILTVNAGALPEDHWTQTHVGGGRIVGEACHFIDLLRFLAAAPIESWQVLSIGGGGGGVRDDKASIMLRFADGSTGTIHYLANGHSSFPKERIEVFCGGGILQLDNFRKMRGFGWRGFDKMNLWKQDKGQAACVAAFVAAIGGGRPAPIAFEEILEVARATILIAEAARA